jgi:MoxR-like ATPase
VTREDRHTHDDSTEDRRVPTDHPVDRQRREPTHRDAEFELDVTMATASGPDRPPGSAPGGDPSTDRTAPDPGDGSNISPSTNSNSDSNSSPGSESDTPSDSDADADAGPVPVAVSAPGSDGAASGPTDRTSSGRTRRAVTDGGMRDPAEADVDVDRLQSKVERVREEMGKRIVGQRAVVDQLLACILANGNALLESVPGLGKTTMVRTLASVTDLSYSRIQNTPDLMPSDITGTEIIRDAGEGQGQEFVFEKGPVFANVVLADEINRATPKTQSALLEAMQERQVTAAGETYRLPSPFFLLATQNPIDQSGTYPLPEAQTDRFLLKLLVEYPSFDEETEIVDRYTTAAEDPPVERVLSREELVTLQSLVREVPIANDIRDEAVRLVRATRENEALEYGASPRASMALVVCAKARAFMRGRSHVATEDVEAMAPPVLRHRIVVDFRAEREGTTPDDVVASLL